MSKEHLKIVIDVDAETGKAKIYEVDRALDRTALSFARLKHNAKAAGKDLAIGAGVAATAFGALAKQIYDVGAEFARITNRLDVGGGRFEFVAKLANDLGLELVSTADSYASLAAAAKGTALEGAQAEHIFKGVSTAVAAMGLSSEQAQGALTAIEQMISKGKVSAEELRGQLGERLPGAFQLAAQAMGVTTSELDKMLSNGQVMAEDLLPKLADALENRFGAAALRAAQSPAAAMNRLHNSYTALMKEIGDTGAYQAIGVAIQGFTDALFGSEQETKALAQEIGVDFKAALALGVDAADVAGKAIIGLGYVFDATKTAAHDTAALVIGAFEGIVRGGQNFAEFWGTVLGSDSLLHAADSAKALADELDALGVAEAKAGIAGEQQLGNGLDKAARKMAELDAKAAAFKARLLSAQAPSAPRAHSGGSAAPAASPAVAKAVADTQAIVAEYQRRAEMARQLTEAMTQGEAEVLLARQEEQQARLDAERQKAIDEAQQKLQDKAAFREAVLAINAEYDQREAQLAMQTAQRIYQIDQQHMSAEHKLWVAGWQGKAQVMSSVMGQMAALMQTHSRKMFEVGKAAATAQAVIDTIAGAQKAYTSLAGIPVVGPALGTAAAAAAIAAGMARVQKIQSTQFGSGGGSVSVGGASFATPGIGGTTPSTAPAAPTAPRQAAQAPSINITVQALHPDALSPEVTQRIADSLAPALHDTLARGGQNVAVTT